MRIRLAVLLSIACPLAAAAQRVSGVVRAAGTSAPISGVVVTTLDSAGHQFSRTLSDESGRYALPLAANAARLRAVRIGFKPASVQIVRTAAAETQVDVVMDREPFALATMVVTSDATCGGKPEEKRRVLELWEQARAALLAAIVAREARPAVVQLVQYQRRMERPNRLITQQQVRVSTGRSTRPVAAARSAEQLATSGYRGMERNEQAFFAPDADVLFDESFGELHCFGFTRGTRERAGQVGLTFRPRKTRNDFVDVDGVLWLNAAATELMGIEYRYTGVDPEAIRAGMGGSMRFQTMANGVAFIDSWSILLPTMSQVIVRGIDRNTTSRGVVNDLAESGGYVVHAAWPDSSQWSNPLGGIRGFVREEKTGLGVPGAVLSIPGTEDVTGQDGGFAFLPLPPGRYPISMLDSTYGPSGKPRRRERQVDVSRYDTAQADFEVPVHERTAPQPDAKRAYEEPRLQAFEQRRSSARGGQFVGEAELRASEGRSMLTILRERMPGLRIVSYRGHNYAASFSNPTMVTPPKLPPDGPSACWIAIYKDGVLVFDELDGMNPPPDVNDFVAGRLSGVEYYADAASIPSQFKSLRNNCGALLFWTRGK